MTKANEHDPTAGIATHLAAESGDLAARLARVEALAEKWNSTPDYNPSEYDQGRMDQRHDMTTELLEALSTPLGERP